MRVKKRKEKKRMFNGNNQFYAPATSPDEIASNEMDVVHRRTPLQR